MKTIVLFDLDGTLVLTGGAGRRALDRAFVDVCGCPDALSSIQFGGMTDRAIARIGLRAAGWDETLENMERVLGRYLEHLREEVRRSEGYRIMPGVLELLDQLGQNSDVGLGLGTGNIERGAEIKLVRGDLFHRFAFGGFGSDAEDRAELLLFGVERGAAYLGTRVSECRVVVVGDTPRDIDAAKAIGAACVAVATGGHTVDELRASGAPVAVSDLSQSETLAAIVGL